MRDPGGLPSIIRHSLYCYQSLQIFTKSRYPYIGKLHATVKIPVIAAHTASQEFQ
jgi:hypothetical protein